MLRHYYVKRGQFANQYWLNYTSNAVQDRAAEKEGCDRITYKEARRLCKLERDRQKYEPSSAGYADDRILPYGVDLDSVYDSKAYYDAYSDYIVFWPNHDQVAV